MDVINPIGKQREKTNVDRIMAMQLINNIKIWIIMKFLHSLNITNMISKCKNMDPIDEMIHGTQQ
jgi:hypothetical protein